MKNYDFIKHSIYLWDTWKSSPEPAHLAKIMLNWSLLAQINAAECCPALRSLAEEAHLLGLNTDCFNHFLSSFELAPAASSAACSKLAVQVDLSLQTVLCFQSGKVFRSKRLARAVSLAKTFQSINLIDFWRNVESDQLDGSVGKINKQSLHNLVGRLRRLDVSTKDICVDSAKIEFKWDFGQIQAPIFSEHRRQIACVNISPLLPKAKQRAQCLIELLKNLELKTFKREDFQKLTALSKSTAQRELNKLVEKKKLRRIGNGPLAQYQWNSEQIS